MVNTVVNRKQFQWQRMGSETVFFPRQHKPLRIIKFIDEREPKKNSKALSSENEIFGFCVETKSNVYNHKWNDTCNTRRSQRGCIGLVVWEFGGEADWGLAMSRKKVFHLTTRYINPITIILSIYQLAHEATERNIQKLQFHERLMFHVNFHKATKLYNFSNLNIIKSPSKKKTCGIVETRSMLR